MSGAGEGGAAPLLPGLREESADDGGGKATVWDWRYEGAAPPGTSCKAAVKRVWSGSIAALLFLFYLLLAVRGPRTSHKAA